MKQDLEHDAQDVSVWGRILCETVGIFNLRQQEQLYRQLRHESKGKTVEATMVWMLAMWDKYQLARPALDWAYASPIKFFESAIWKEENQWPRKVKEVPNESRVEQAIRRTREKYAGDSGATG